MALIVSRCKRPRHVGRLSTYVSSRLDSIFYFGWVFWAIPSNLIMQRSPPAYYLAFNIFMWGEPEPTTGWMHRTMLTNSLMQGSFCAAKLRRKTLRPLQRFVL